MYNHCSVAYVPIVLKRRHQNRRQVRRVGYAAPVEANLSQVASGKFVCDTELPALGNLQSVSLEAAHETLATAEPPAILQGFH
jgi:hypothetical protein